MMFELSIICRDVDDRDVDEKMNKLTFPMSRTKWLFKKKKKKKKKSTKRNHNKTVKVVAYK